VDAFTVSAFLQRAGRADWGRVAAILMGLKDENTRVNALVDMAGVMLRPTRQ
jgi:hypothetical protein